MMIIWNIMNKSIKKQINNILTNWNNAEDIDSIIKIKSDISSVLYSIRLDKNFYDIKLIKSLYYIRGKLYTRYNKLARKRRIA